MFVRTGRFVRTDRLLQSRDFKRVLESGERRSSRSFAIFLSSQPLRAKPAGIPRPKLGVTVSKQVGNAVVRNRIKRRVREWFRHNRHGLPAKKDVVVIARPAAKGLSGSAVADALNQLMVGSR